MIRISQINGRVKPFVLKKISIESGEKFWYNEAWKKFGSVGDTQQLFSGMAMYWYIIYETMYWLKFCCTAWLRFDILEDIKKNRT